MGWRLRLYEADGVHQLVATGSGESFKHVGFQEYGVTIGVCPVVRYTAHLDLRGRATGDIEPIIPVLGRIDQTTFDRLVVQRFASFIVRTVTGMAKPDTEETAAAEKLKLAVEDILVAEDPDTKFGTLAASPLSPFIEAHDADVRALAALSQSPAHELVGTMANLSAESLAAAEASLTRRVTRLKHGVGEDHEKTLRLGALIMGDTDAAADAESELRWRDMESRSLAQAADALGKIATMLQVPVEMLWEKIPGWTDQDVERAKQLLEDGGPLVKLMEQLAAGQAPALDPVPARGGGHRRGRPPDPRSPASAGQPRCPHRRPDPGCVAADRPDRRRRDPRAVVDGDDPDRPLGTAYLSPARRQLHHDVPGARARRRGATDGPGSRRDDRPAAGGHVVDRHRARRGPRGDGPGDDARAGSRGRPGPLRRRRHAPRPRRRPRHDRRDRQERQPGARLGAGRVAELLPVLRHARRPRPRLQRGHGRLRGA